MEKHYTVERNTQMLIYLMKAHNIKKAVVSPGATNVCFVGSLQSDPFFDLYSAVDERSAAYMACGLAAESGEAVALSCTGATASRNYVPGLTEAFYRNLPVLAITAAQPAGRFGHLVPQFVERSVQMKDLVKYSLQLPPVTTLEDEWAYGLKINEALLELKHHGGGPVHINITTVYSNDFSVVTLPPVPVLQRYLPHDKRPEIPKGRVAIFVGAHLKWTPTLTQKVDDFCERYNGVVLMDQTSNYKGKYGFLFNLVSDQDLYNSPVLNIDLVIDIGSISGAYGRLNPTQVWRVHPDGILRDRFRKLTAVFEMGEEEFFSCYAVEGLPQAMSYWAECQAELARLRQAARAVELPFSNVWVARELAQQMPVGSVLHLGILNSLRSWNLADHLLQTCIYANTGGFGIDGCVSTLIGASLADSKKLFFGVVGDLAFFYDMNSLGNRHVGSNLRLMVVNNGRGTEFRNYWHPAEAFGDEADKYMAAAGHFGQKSLDLLRHYATDLGFRYISAGNKEEFLTMLPEFTATELTDKPILWEIFTDSQDESAALYKIKHLAFSSKAVAKETVKKVLGEKGVSVIKKFLH